MKILFILLISIIGTSAYADNSPTGEELWRIHDREAEQAAQERDKKILASKDDRKIWKNFTLFSESITPKDLTIPLIYSANLTTTLDPKKGTLTIEKKGLKQIFQIDSQIHDKNYSTCPKYNIKIIDGSSTHAIFEKDCSQIEYRPNHFSMSVSFYLYDMATASMIGLWSVEKINKDDHFPFPKPIPTIKKTNDGYQYDWVGIDTGDPDRTKQAVHAKYIRKINSKTQKLELVCINPEDPKGEQTGGPCETIGLVTLLNESRAC